MTFIWSYSAIECFDDSLGGCPEKFRHKYILKDLPPEVKTLEQQKGIDDHQAVEQAAKEHRPVNAMLGSILRLAEGKKLITEAKMGITAELAPTDFWGEGVWGRGVVDIGVIGDTSAFLGDWKTGKVKEKPLQGEIFTLMTFIHYPPLEEITFANLWLKTGKPGTTMTHRRSDVPHLLAGVVEKVRPIERAIETDSYPLRPGPLCGWCPVMSCHFNPRRGG